MDIKPRSYGLPIGFNVKFDFIPGELLIKQHVNCCWELQLSMLVKYIVYLQWINMNLQLLLPVDKELHFWGKQNRLLSCQ